jgi:EAL and modified HD-GYP domain-containing signal transduction protein
MDVYVARQVILDINKKVFAYELLFRNSNVNEFISVENTNPTLEVIRNSFSVIGLDKVTEGKLAFINFDEELIKSDLIEAFPKDRIVIEILETVRPSKEIIERCKTLKDKGYILALDDFDYSEEFDAIIEYIDVIKVDFRLTKGEERKKVIHKVRNEKIKFLAEKVETEEEFRQAVEYGYSYFQGYFFCKPVIFEGKDIAGYKFTYMNLINELNKEIVDIRNIESLIKNDVSLSYKLLKLANSAYFSLRREITSIGDAIIIIGIKELRKWMFIITLQNMGENSIGELVKMSLIRAFFAELLSKKIKIEISSFDAFLIGMLSLMDALVGMPMEKLLGELLVPNHVREALLGNKNILTQLLELIINYEKGKWEMVSKLAEELGVDEDFVRDCYLESIQSIRSIEGV